MNRESRRGNVNEPADRRRTVTLNTRSSFEAEEAAVDLVEYGGSGSRGERVMNRELISVIDEIGRQKGIDKSRGDRRDRSRPSNGRQKTVRTG